MIPGTPAGVHLARETGGFEIRADTQHIVVQQIGQSFGGATALPCGTGDIAGHGRERQDRVRVEQLAVEVPDDPELAQAAAGRIELDPKADELLARAVDAKEHGGIAEGGAFQAEKRIRVKKSLRGEERPGQLRAEDAAPDHLRVFVHCVFPAQNGEMVAFVRFLETGVRPGLVAMAIQHVPRFRVQLLVEQHRPAGPGHERELQAFQAHPDPAFVFERATQPAFFDLARPGEREIAHGRNDNPRPRRQNQGLFGSVRGRTEIKARYGVFKERHGCWSRFRLLL